MCNIYSIFIILPYFKEKIPPFRYRKISSGTTYATKSKSYSYPHMEDVPEHLDGYEEPTNISDLVLGRVGEESHPSA